MKIVVLTASAMKKEIDGELYSGKCVTAYDLKGKRVLRLVGDVNGAPMESPYCEKFIPMNVYTIRIKKHCPILCQTENVFTNYRATVRLRKYRKGIKEIYRLWVENNRTEPSFMDDGQRRLADVSPYDHSLEIIKVSSLCIEHRKCSFIYNGIRFDNMSITDPEYTQDNDGVYRFDSAYLVVSIPFENYNGLGYFKFVASVFPVKS